MQKFSAIRPAVRRTFQKKNSWVAASPPPPARARFKVYIFSLALSAMLVLILQRSLRSTRLHILALSGLLRSQYTVDNHPFFVKLCIRMVLKKIESWKS